MTDNHTQYPATTEQRCAELQQSRAVLIQELEKSAEQATAKQGDRWSIAEIAFHIYLVESAITMQLKQLLAGKSGNPLSDEHLQAEWQAISTRARNREIKFAAPEFVAPRDTPPLAESFKLLEQSRATLLATLEGVTMEKLASVTAPHPAPEMGNISGAGWLTLIANHELRHRDQIVELKAALAQTA
jgi:uncharacterized damage-inducible protein DinB